MPTRPVDILGPSICTEVPISHSVHIEFELLMKRRPVASPSEDSAYSPILPYNNRRDYVVGVFHVFLVDIRRRVKILFREFTGIRGMWWMNYWSIDVLERYNRYLVTIRRRRWEYDEMTKWINAAEDR